jgi:benzil reductase ((S)-benzoin forming)
MTDDARDHKRFLFFPPPPPLFSSPVHSFLSRRINHKVAPAATSTTIERMTGGCIIVTGAGTGIGRAVALHFASLGHTVLGVGRRMEPLESLRKENPSKIHIVSADVSESRGRKRVLDALPPPGTVRYLVNNAGVLEPIKPLIEVTEDEFRQHMQVNLEAPLFLTQTLLEKFDKDARVLNISSGAARNPYVGWGAYCTSKAALNMVYRVLDAELKDRGIRVGSVRPGVVDTPMQSIVRSSDKKVFPNLDRFIKLKEDNGLVDPNDVAKFICSLLIEKSPDEFAGKEWDIRD